MSHRMVQVAVMAIVIVLLVTCGGSQMTPIRPFEQRLNPYTAFYFAVVPDIFEDIDREMAELEEQVIQKVNDSAFFIVTQPGKCTTDCNQALNVVAIITDIRKVSSTGRFFGGVFAGKARMAADIYFTDGKTGDTLAIYNVSGKSGGTALAGGTETAVRRTAEEIFELIAGNYR